MKLVYSIPNKLYYIQNFLDKNTYKNIHNSIIKERKNLNLHSAKLTWDKSLTKNILSPKKIEIEKYPLFEKLKILTHRNKFYSLSIKETITTIHYMEKGSGINWHNDGNWKYGATYYLNNKWNKDWGGEFMFTCDNGHGYIPVVGNSLVIIKSPLNHKVTPVLSPIIPRISVQMFII